MNDISRVAAELGLEKACALDAEAFATAREKAHALARRIPSPESPAAEPAHVLRLPDRPADEADEQQGPR